MRLFRLLSELKRRRVYQVAAAYAVAGFAVLEAADLVLPALSAPAWIYRGLVILVLAGFPVVVGLAWTFDVTPEGVRRDPGPGHDTGTDESAIPSDRAAPDGAAEPERSIGPRSGPPVRLPGARRLMAGTLVLGLAGVGAWLAGRRAAHPPAPDPASSLAVLPFAPAVPDSGLERLGRDLVITLSSTLAATAGIGTVEPLAVLATIPPGSGPLTLEEAGEAARSLGAERVIHGALLRSDGGIRVEVGLYETDGLRRVGNQSLTADHVGALTDSATLAALRLLWRDATSSPPSPGAISTGSVTALQAYLDGERAIAEGRWREAPEHFARAVAADSTFWFAYWRLQYALGYHGSPVDSVVRARVWEHRDQLPDRDRLLIEAWSAPAPERIRILREVTTRYPSYWPAWWHLADTYVHTGGYLGYTRSDSRTALERTLALNPRFVSAWSHLFWVASATRDVETMRRVIQELSAAHYDRVTLQEAGINTLTYYRAQLAIAESDGVPASVIEAGVSELSSYRGPAEPEGLASGLASVGFLAAQIELSREILRRGNALAPMEWAQHLALAHAWAGRGGWDSALVAADRYAASATDATGTLFPYQIAVSGAWAGALDPETARARRPTPGLARETPPAVAAETAWLDGVLASAAASGPALALARDRLVDSGGEWSGLLDRSLDAFATALAGDTVGAARQLVALEQESAAVGAHGGYGPAHPFLNGIQRLSAARWLLAAGDTVAARTLLPWHEAVFPGRLYRLQLANQVLATPALRLRRELAEAAGRPREAAAYDALFRERWDPGVAGSAEGHRAP